MQDACGRDRLAGRWAKTALPARRSNSHGGHGGLPRDPASPVFHNYDSPLWVRWMKWRSRCVGDWRVIQRRALDEVNPNLCIMIYTTHYGVYGRAPWRDYGISLMEAARGCDFIGTEIMSRNVFDCYRPVFSFRKIKSAIGDHFGGAIWGLVYHSDDKNIAYFGWALQQMNRQTTWMDMIPGVDMLRYLDWPHQVKLDRVSSLADTAILFSAATRNFARKYISFRHYNFFDTWGYSEIMDDGHIQHDFILDEDLEAKRLSRYKLVIVANNSCMSADRVEALRQYVRQGGVLLVSGIAATQNEVGFWSDNFQLADVMGVDYCEVETTAGRKWVFEKDRKLADVLLRMVRLSVDNSFDVKAVAVPERVLMNVHEQRNDEGRDVLVHFLNATGAPDLKKGDIVPDKKPADSFPALASDLVFDIRAAGIAGGYTVSPDYASRRPVAIEERKDGYVRVTVKKADGAAYGVVHLTD